MPSLAGPRLTAQSSNTTSNSSSTQKYDNHFTAIIQSTCVASTSS